ATYGLRYVLDELGDIFLMGAISLEAVSEDEVDRLMGCAITYADEVFPALVNIGFATAAERERRFRERLAREATAD
ncbi:MAG: YbjN domain-containing protein, partial [Actinomycetota bacterium]